MVLLQAHGRLSVGLTTKICETLCPSSGYIFRTLLPAAQHDYGPT